MFNGKFDKFDFICIIVWLRAGLWFGFGPGKYIRDAVIRCVCVCVSVRSMRSKSNMIDRAPPVDVLLPLVNASLRSNGNQYPVTVDEIELYSEYLRRNECRSVTPPIEDFEQMSFG